MIQATQLFELDFTAKDQRKQRLRTCSHHSKMTRVILLIVAIFSHCRWPVYSFQFVDSFALNPVAQIRVWRPMSSALPTQTILPRKDRNALRSSPDPVIESKMNGDDDELMSLKVELTAYLEKRKEVGADEVAKE